MNKILFSSKSNEWATPQDFFDNLNKKYNFNLDPCATPINAKCDLFYTIEDNGLQKNWKGKRVFCNPPYGRDVKYWVRKCAIEAKNNDTKIVLLIPARTDTRYFHKYIYQKPNVKIEFIKGRLKFGDGKNSAPFPSMVVIFN